jgi:hypothetical protein
MNNEVQVVEQQAMVIPRMDPERATEIMLARAYPRKEVECIERATALATIDKDVAESCFYSVPRAGKRIVGPSVRLAEIMATTWGNLRVASRVIDESDNQVTAQAVCDDLQTNVKVMVEKRRRITKRDGTRYDDDGITNAMNAAASIAMRDAVFKIIPKTFVNAVYEKARDVALGNAKSMKERRHNLVKYWVEKGVTEKQLLEHLGYKKQDEITLDDLDYLIGIASGIKNRDYDVEDVFSKKRDVAEKASINMEDITATVTPPDVPKANVAPPYEVVEPVEESSHGVRDPVITDGVEPGEWNKPSKDDKAKRSKLNTEIVALLQKKGLDAAAFDKIMEKMFGADVTADTLTIPQLEELSERIAGLASKK